MTVKERVLSSRLIQKIDNNTSYATQLGLSYAVQATGSLRDNRNPIQKEEKKND